MAIEIIDGFKVNSAVPVDNRIVASGSTARNAITYKYEGLRVFDTSDSTPYVWLSNSWKKESQMSLSVPSSITLGYASTSTYKVGQVLKVVSADNQLTNSNMFELNWLNASGAITNRVIAINHIDGSGNNTTNTVSSTAKLDVKGSVKATSFEGSGANITDISPLNFNTSTSKIKINQIEPGTNGYVLRTTVDPLSPSSSILQWIDLNTAIAPSAITTQIETGASSTHYLTFVPNTSGGALYTNFSGADSLIGVIPSTNQIVVKNSNNAGSPPYSFINEQNTGIYRSAAGSLAISILGTKKIEVDTNGLKVNAGNAANPGISFIGANNYGLYQTTTGNNRIGVVVASNEMMRIKSSGTQGNGNTSIYGDGGLLSLVGRTHAYMEFYRLGSNNPDAASVTTPNGSGRGAWIGYPSASLSDFYVTNVVTNTSLGLLNNGRVYITSRANSVYGVEIGNAGSGTVTGAKGVYVYGTFTSAQLQSPHAGVIAQFDAKGGSTTYTSVFVTTQGLLIWGCPLGTGVTQPTYSGSAARPSLSFNGNGSTGLYSDASNTIGISTGGVERMRLSDTGVRIGTTGVQVKTHVSGWIKFTRNSNGVGFSFIGSRGGVTAVTDISGPGSSFSTGTGLIRLSVTFANNTFQGNADDNTVVASYGLDDTSGNILFYTQSGIAGKVMSNNTLEFRMDFSPTTANGYYFRINFFIESIV